MHNSVKLLRVFPDRDVPLFASSWASTADRNGEFFQIERSKSEKSSKIHAYVLHRAKMAPLMASACSNSPSARVSERWVNRLKSFIEKESKI